MGLWEALELDMAVHRAVALVGGGGKSSTMYALAKEARAAGKRVVVTTTTHMMPHPRLVLTGDTEAVGPLLDQHGIITLGSFFQAEKLGGVGTLLDYKDAADVVLMEADGARLRPLKVPREGEPVLQPGVDAVLAVAGMDSVGEPIGGICHRVELVCALLDKPPEAPVTPADVVKILTSPRGGRKGVPEGIAFRCVLNKADTPARRAAAEETARLLAEQGVRAVITCYTEGERGGRDLF